MVVTEDRSINSELEREMAKRAGIKWWSGNLDRH